MMPLLLASAAFACPNLDAEVERATGALVAGSFDTARDALANAESSFTCAPATTAQVARFWLVEGAAAQLRGDAAAARGPLAAARHAAPDLFDDRLGPDVKAAWEAAASAGRGTLLLEPARPAFVDGAGVSTWPVPVDAVPHLVQVVGGDGAVRFGRLVRIAPGDDVLVQTGLGTERDPLVIADAAVPLEPKHKRSPALLIAAGIAAAGAGACAGGAYAQEAQMQAAADTGALDAAFTRQQILGYSTYGLAGAAAAALTLHLVLP
jgi:hypothetical protein